MALETPHPNESLKPIRLGRIHFAVLATTLFLVLPTVVAIVFERDIHFLYLETFVAPEMQRSFGFTAEWQTIREMDLYVITSIVPDGPLGKMGFEVGDIPWEYHGGFEAFYSALEEAHHGTSTRVELMRAADVAKDNYAKRWILITP